MSPGTSSRSSRRRTFPPPNRLALILDDQPCLADDIVNHAEEPVVLLAHADKELVEKARRSCRSTSIRCRRCIDRRRARGPNGVWGTDNVFKSFLVQRGDVEAALATADIASSKASTKRARRNSSTSSRRASSPMADAGRRHHGVGLAAVSVLRAQGAGDAVRPAGSSRARRADGDRRRVRRQGRVPVAHRRARRAARVEVRPAGEAHLRPRRGHGGDDEAPSVADAAPDRPSIATAGSSRWTSTSCSTAARTARCRRSCCRAARSTRRARTSVRTFAFAARAVATSTPPHGAFRGFGAPQSLFALERHMDVVAARGRARAGRVPAPQLHHRRARRARSGR